MTDPPNPASPSEPRIGPIGILGGTGEQGRGLAYRWAAAGLDVTIGSRDAARAAEVAAQIGLGVRGGANLDVAADATIVVLAVPWAGHLELVRSVADIVAGKVVVDCVNPLGFDDKGAYVLDVPEGSAAQQAASVLVASQVVAAFHHVSAVVLNDPELASVDCDVMVLGDNRAATDLVQLLAAAIPGVRGCYAGRLRNAHQIESLTANLISVNRRYRAHAGIRLTGL
jgi:8-hydroxy-5-deazaflavin:NADPH oxidoreductase